MAPLCSQPTFDFEADHEVVKMGRAAVRHRKLYIKQSECTRIRSARDWSWGKGIEGAKPHHAVRAATRTCLAKGGVGAQEDMPSIVSMSKQGDKGARRKPAIAHMVRGTKAVDNLSDVDTTADEADESCSGLGSEPWCRHDSPVCSPRRVLAIPAPEQMDWPALHVDASNKLEAVDESRSSHLEIALRFVEESLNEQAAMGRLRARKETIAFAEREASLWKTTFKKRRQRPRAATMAPAHTETMEPLPMIESTQNIRFSACLSSETDHVDVDVKLERAATRHRKLFIKRSEFTRSRSARDWTWGSSIEGATPHRAVRAAVRARLSKGAVESHEDMPSIVCLGRLGDKGTRREPGVARMMRNTIIARMDAINATSLHVNPVLSKIETGDRSRQQTHDPEQSLQECIPAISAAEFLSAPYTFLEEGEQVKKQTWCVIA